MLQYDALDRAKLTCREANIVVERDGREPEFCRRITAVDVNVTGFAEVSAEEVEPIWSFAQERRHHPEFTAFDRAPGARAETVAAESPPRRHF